MFPFSRFIAWYFLTHHKREYVVKNQPMAVSEKEMKKLAEFGDFVVYFVLFFFSTLFLFNKEFSFVDCIQIRVVTGQREAVISALVACPSLCLCHSLLKTLILRLFTKARSLSLQWDAGLQTKETVRFNFLLLLTSIGHTELTMASFTICMM